MLWTYETEIGVFWIKPDGKFRFTLGINEEILGNYITPVMAAEDVSSRVTGHLLWDTHSSTPSPSDLTQWNFYKK